MNILVIGSGGREHAFATELKNSPKCRKLYVAPGNAGTAEIAENVDLAITDFEGIKHFLISREISMLVVGPEEPLVKGITDYLNQDSSTQHVLVVGPSRRGAALEGSKNFSKEFMARNHIPTASYQTFTKDTFREGI